MRFYDRVLELQALKRTRELAFENHSQMTAVMGRRRIGKTALVTKSCESTPMVYLFVSRTTEALLCKDFIAEISRVLPIFIPESIERVSELFEMLMSYGKEYKFTIFFDEFQELYRVNSSIYSDIQRIWDKYKDTTHVNFVAAGSVQTMMHKVFMDYGEPLYGRCDSILNIKPFTPSVIKEIMADNNPGYTNDDLLALYAITGGVPKYIESFVDRKILTVDSMIEDVFRANSLFLEEGNVLLIQEFGKDFGKYYGILSSISGGRNTMAEIKQNTGISSCGGLIERLEKDYELIVKKRPVLATPGSQTVRYEIADNFLHYWFRYVVKYQNYIQNGLIEKVADIAKADYKTYSGLILEKYFREKLRELQRYYVIGSWWQSSREKNNNQNEIDIVAIEPGNTVVLVAEVKRERKNFKPEELKRKTELLRTKILPKAEIENRCLTLEDI